MIITIQICDVCLSIVRGVYMMPHQARGHEWHVAPCCKRKPFQVVENANAHKAHLLTRIESLVATELSLLKDPAS